MIWRRMTRTSHRSPRTRATSRAPKQEEQSRRRLRAANGCRGRPVPPAKRPKAASATRTLRSLRSATMSCPGHRARAGRPHYPAGAPAPGPHPSAGELPPGSGGPSVIHSPPPPPPPPPAVLAKPKLWSLAEIATSSDKVKDGSGGSEGSPCPPCPGPVGGQTLGGSRASPAPAPARSPSAQCPFPGGTVLSRPLYYTAPFYPGYTNYGSFGHLHGHPGPGPGPTGGPGSHFNGLNQTVLNRADVLAKDPKMLRSQSQLDLCKDTPYELKKGMSDI